MRSQSLTPILQVYKSLAAEAVAKHKVEAKLFTCELDRNPLKAYGGSICFDSVPSFRCQGPQIFIVSLDDLHLPEHKQKVHRFLTVRERFALQGRPHDLANHFEKKAAAIKASGNAFNVLALACMLAVSC